MNFLATIHPRLVELAKKIDLGERWTTSGCCPHPVGEGKPDPVHYPRLYITGKKEPLDIPEQGKAIVDYKVTNRSMNKNNDEERHSIDIEVQSIEPHEPEEKKPAQSALFEDLRRLRMFCRNPRMMNLEARSPLSQKRNSWFPGFEINFSDPRPRNSMGEYTSDPGEGVDPNQMAAAYGPPDVSESHVERVKRFFLKRRQAAEAA